MKVKVIKKFKDANTGKIHNVGDEMEITADRLKEIKSVGNFVKEIKEKQPAKEAAKN